MFRSSGRRSRPAKHVAASHFPFLFCILQTDFACPSERSHGERRHCDRVRHGKRNHPRHGPHSPLAPRRRQPIYGEHGEKYAHSFVKQLPRHAPERAHRRHRRTPDERHHPGIHAPDSIAFCAIRPIGCPSLTPNVSRKQRCSRRATPSTGQVTSAGRIPRPVLFRSCSKHKIVIGRAFDRR